jgi:carnitine O-palmitoyltransferase 2
VLYAADCIPMCMSAYDRMFGTVRVPRVGEDEIVHYANSTHIVVTCAGRVFSMDVYRRCGATWRGDGGNCSGSDG